MAQLLTLNRRENDVAVVDILSDRELMNLGEKALNYGFMYELAKEGTKTLILDYSKHDYLSSMSLGALVRVRQLAENTITKTTKMEWQHPMTPGRA